ncbi:unnamed protein product [Microthlaspi erraticum]|uniref:Uncharacterized protein n=1 Tax=Microthlaspi erraticum TaxID=1685480 RepID=A0A6D2KKX4_9BRAS|nr:unnamed protein product [Microthlaspi erraticum]
MAKGITSEAIGAHDERSPNPHVQIASNFTRSHKIRLVDETSFQYNEFLTIQEMADGVKFGRSRASKMADNPNHGIYRGHRLKSPPSSLHIASKEENPDWNEQNWRRPTEDVPGANLKIFSKEISNHSFKRPQTSPVAILYNIGRRNFKIGRGNLHGSSCSPYHHHPVDQNGPVSAKKAKNRKPRENCHIHPTKSNSYDVCTSQFMEATSCTTDLHIKGQQIWSWQYILPQGHYELIDLPKTPTPPRT